MQPPYTGIYRVQVNIFCASALRPAHSSSSLYQNWIWITCGLAWRSFGWPTSGTRTCSGGRCAECNDNVCCVCLLSVGPHYPLTLLTLCLSPPSSHPVPSHPPHTVPLSTLLTPSAFPPSSHPVPSHPPHTLCLPTLLSGLCIRM